MREIKFRAWDDVAKRMSYSSTEQFDDMLGFRFDHFETDKPVYMQFTGLRDHNGREIYEGDIVTGPALVYSIISHWNNGCERHGESRPFREPEQKRQLYEIRYHEASYKLFERGTNEWTAVLNHHVSSMAKDLEVIGNIYENPELLEREGDGA